MVEQGEPAAGRAIVTVDVSGRLAGVPFLARPMLDLWVHALHGPDPFLIVGRPEDVDSRFIQTYRNAPDDFTLECWDDGEELFSVKIPAPGLVVDLIWDWIKNDWTRLDRLAGRSSP